MKMILISLAEKLFNCQDSLEFVVIDLICFIRYSFSCMDISYLLFLQRLRSALPPFWEKFFNAVSVLDLSIYSILLIPCLLYWCMDKRKGQFVLFSYVGARFINAVLKLTFCCYRPWIRDARVIPSQMALAGAGGYSFPSGHSSSGVGLFGSAGWAFRKSFWGLLTAVFWIYSLLVLFSRNYLGVHTPQDVLVGALVGILALYLSERFLNWIEGNEAKDVLVLFVSGAVCVLVLIYFICKPYPVDYVDGKVLVDPLRMQLSSLKQVGEFAGLFAGWFIERKWIKFSTDCSVLEKLFRFVLCGLGLLFVNRYAPLLLSAFLGTRGAVIMNRFVFIFYIVCVAPLVCRILHVLFCKLDLLAKKYKNFA